MRLSGAGPARMRQALLSIALRPVTTVSAPQAVFALGYLLDAGEVPRLSLAEMRRLTSRALPWRAWAELIHSVAVAVIYLEL